MNKEAVKQELLEVYGQELDVLLRGIEKAEDFVELEQEMLRHLSRSGKGTTEVVQKHKTFSP